MGYLSIQNLYRPEGQHILLFKQCYALEKVHGTSAHLSWAGNNLSFHSGGEKHERFVSVFAPDIADKFVGLGHPKVTVYGEAYGGKQQGMSDTYGTNLCFIVFDVKIDDVWLSVPQAYDVATKLGLEFVPFEIVSTDIEELNRVRDLPSEVAVRRCIETPMPREGVVLRPLVEMTLNNGERIICKHKQEGFRETKHPRKVVDASQLQVLTDAEAIADEYVVPMRMEHILLKLPEEQRKDPKMIPVIMNLMIEDVLKESHGEIVVTDTVRKAIGKKAAVMFKASLKL